MTSETSTRSDQVIARSSDDRFAAHLRGFGPLGIVAILVILAGNAVFIPLSALLVLAWVWRSRTPWRDRRRHRVRRRVQSISLGGIDFRCVAR